MHDPKEWAVNDFVISYVESDQQWAEWAARILEGRGYRCDLCTWDFAWDRSPRETVDELLAGSAHWLAVVSPAYLVAVHSHVEWVDLFIRGGLPVLPIRVKKCNITAKFGWVNVVDLHSIGDDQAEKALLEAAFKNRGAPEPATHDDLDVEESPYLTPGATTPRRTSRPGRTPTPGGTPTPGFTPTPGSTPRTRRRSRRGGERFRNIWRIPWSRAPHFVGREPYLDAVDSSLDGDGVVLLAQKRPVEYGVGLSQIAVEYAHERAADYRVVWWVRSGNPVTIVDDLSRLAVELGLDAKSQDNYPAAIKALQTWLAENDRWLLVFDNARTADQLKSYFPAQRKGHVIVTSTNPEWPWIRRRLCVQPLNRQDSVQYLLFRTGDMNESAAASVADELMDIPLAMHLAGSFISATSASLVDFVDIFTARRREFCPGVSRPSDPVMLLEILLSICVQQVGMDNEATVDLLKVCALFSEYDIPFNHLLAQAEKLPRNVAKLLRDSQASNKATSLLQKFGLFDTQEDLINMHPQVQQLLLAWQLYPVELEENRARADFLKLLKRNRLERKDPRLWANAVLKVVQEEFPNEVGEGPTRRDCRRLVGHATRLVKHADKLNLDPKQAAPLATKVGRYLAHSACYSVALQALDAALKFHSVAHGKDDRGAAAILRIKGHLYWATGKMQEAKLTLRKSLDIERAHNKRPTEELANAYKEMGHIHQELGEMSEAQACYEQSLTIHRSIDGEMAKSVAIDRTNLALVAQKLGDVSTAYNHYEHALEIQKEVYGTKHHSIATCIKNMGGLMFEIGDYPKAKQAFLQALKIDSELHPEGHPELGRDYNNLGLVFQRLDQPAEAFQYYERALQINIGLFGAEHPKVAIQYNNLATLLEAQGKRKEAAEYYRRALGTLEKVYGERHQMTTTIRRNLEKIEF